MENQWTFTFSSHLMRLDPIKNHIFYVMSYLSMYSFLTDTSVTLDLFPLVLSHRITMSNNLFSLSHSDLFYSTVEIVWHTFRVCWVNCHVVTTHLTHSSDVSFIHVFCSDRFILNAQHQLTYSLKTIMVMTVDYRNPRKWLRK